MKEEKYEEDSSEKKGNEEENSEKKRKIQHVRSKRLEEEMRNKNWMRKEWGR